MLLNCSNFARLWKLTPSNCFKRLPPQLSARRLTFPLVRTKVNIFAMNQQFGTIRYEYKVLPLDSRYLAQAELNELGRDGWLLVSTLPSLIFVRSTTSLMPSTQIRPQLLTINEAAHELNISRTKLYQMIQGKTIESIKLGRSVRIPLVAISKFLNNR